MIEMTSRLRFQMMAGAALLSLLACAGTARAQEPSPETTEGAPLGEVLSFLLTNQAVATGDFVKDAVTSAVASARWKVSQPDCNGGVGCQSAGERGVIGKHTVEVGFHVGAVVG